ncbi:MAG TPA: hypothetical protein VFZ47_09930, partial [Chitinophagaceae bacterium]
MRISHINPIVQACLLFVVAAVILSSCESKGSKPAAQDIVKTEEAWEIRTSRNLKDNLTYAVENKGKLNDTLFFQHINLANTIYQDNQYQLIWSIKGENNRIAESLFSFISNARLYGLFPSDYDFTRLEGMRSLMKSDTLAQKDAALWARQDIMFTNAFFSLVRDLKLGRLPNDSTTLRKDSLLTDSFYIAQLQSAIHSRQVNEVLHGLEPKHAGYDSLKAYLPRFLDSARFRPYTYLTWPYKDSLAFYRALNERLYQERLLDTLRENPDTATIATALRKYQAIKKIKVSGKPSEGLVNYLNMTDLERFKVIAI